MVKDKNKYISLREFINKHNVDLNMPGILAVIRKTKEKIDFIRIGNTRCFDEKQLIALIENRPGVGRPW